MGVTRLQVETPRSDERAAARVDGGPVFFSAGQAAAGEFHCSECGYGVVVRAVLPACPMCRGRSWEERSWSPFPF